MRTLFLLTVLANIVFAIALPFLADVQNADDFKMMVMTSVITVFAMVFIAAIIFGTSWLIGICPKETINIPNRDYWLGDENRPRTLERIRFYLYEISAVTMFFILLIQAVSLRPPENFDTVSIAAAVLLCVFITFETVRLFLSYRLPKNTDQPV